MKNILRSSDFYLLLIYSLLPGIGKIIGFQNLMVGYVPIIFYWLFKQKPKLNKNDIPFILFVFTLIVYIPVSIIAMPTNFSGVILGVGLDLFPMFGYFLFKDERYDEDFLKYILLIVVIHGLIGIYLYPMFGLADKSNPIVKSLTTGVAWGRMSSVSGSLGFGNLIMIGFIISLFYCTPLSVFLFFLVILSMQRSSWLGSAFAFFLYFCFLIRKREWNKIFYISILVFFASIFVLLILPKYIKIDFTYLLVRLSQLFSGGSEDGGVRIQNWMYGLKNFVSAPTGAGFGQIGQVAARYEGGIYKTCPDGDYIRMLGEYGISYLIFFIIFIFEFIYLFVFVKLERNEFCIMCITLATSLQLIGSNISEFYFDNFLYWLFIGRNFYTIQKRLFGTRFMLYREKLVV